MTSAISSLPSSLDCRSRRLSIRAMRCRPSEREEVLAGKRCFAGDGVAINSEQYNGLQDRRVQEKNNGRSGKRWARPRGGELQASRLAVFAAAILGRAVSDSARAGRQRQADGRVRAVDEKDLPVDLPHLDDFKPHGRPEPPLDKAPAGVALSRDRRQALQARNQHHAAVGRFVLVLPAVSRSEERRALDRSGNRKGLDAGRSVRRRRGACRAAPAVLAILAQGALRPRRSSACRSRSRSS